jgi:hypothetical protein
MNEDRKTFTPTLFDHNYNVKLRNEGSVVQSWFVGTHSDIGGGHTADGLSLYPLQWMLIESKTYGLVLEHSPKDQANGLIENPLLLAFPAEELSIAHATPANPPTVDHENVSP